MRGHNICVVDDIRPVLKVTDPQIMGMVPGPSFTYFFLQHTELDSSRASLFKMPVKGGTGHSDPIHLLKEAIDGARASARLFFFQLNGGIDDFS